MKTISLNERAYERLASWKKGPKDSFSKVVERVVLPCGNLGNIAKAAESLPVLTAEQIRTLDRGMQDLKDWSEQRDPWTS